MARKLTALELIGPLVVLTVNADICRRRHLIIWVDNAGSVAVYKRGYSSACRLSSTLAKAIGTVAAGLGCEVAIEKVTRCSATGPVLADLLSKARFNQFRNVASDNRFSNQLLESTLEWR